MFPTKAARGLTWRVEGAISPCAVLWDLGRARGAEETAPGACTVRAARTPFGDVAPGGPQCASQASALGEGLSGLRAPGRSGFTAAPESWVPHKHRISWIRFWPLEGSGQFGACPPTSHRGPVRSPLSACSLLDSSDLPSFCFHLFLIT